MCKPPFIVVFLEPVMTKTLQELVNIRRDHFSQVEIAEKLEMSRQQLSNIENGRQGNPSILLVERYAAALGFRLVIQQK